MGFATLKTNLLAGYYKTYDSFVNDLFLIWHNAKVFTLKEKPLYKEAVEMEKISKAEIQKLIDQKKLPNLSIPDGDRLTVNHQKPISNSFYGLKKTLS